MSVIRARERLVWVDHARAAGIVLVVVGHAVLSLERSGVPVDMDLLRAVETAIYAFHMPLFFVLAGMTHGLASKPGVAAAARSLWWTIVAPYLIWSTIWVGLKAAFPAASNTATGLTSAWEILWIPVDHFWFLYVLLIVRLAWYAVDATGSAMLRKLAVVAPLAVCFVGFEPGGGVFSLWLFFWASFYGVGVLLGTTIGALRRPTLAVIVAAGVAVWAGGLILVPSLLPAGVGIVRTAVAIGGSLALLAAAALAPVRGGAMSRLVGFVGEASLAIFLTHTLVGAAVRIGLRQTDLLTAPLYLIAAVGLGIVLPALAYFAVLRAGAQLSLPLARYVGFGTARDSYYIPHGGRLPDAAGPTPAA
ncbi:MAG TPA: acyltransferase [Methylomirabilota bacterium]|nr:acyltransferase [Methylomirabilota bacterium]